MQELPQQDVVQVPQQVQVQVPQQVQVQDVALLRARAWQQVQALVRSQQAAHQAGSLCAQAPFCSRIIQTKDAYYLQF